MKSPPKVIAVSSLCPPNECPRDDVLALSRVWLQEQTDEVRSKADRIFARAGVDKRYSALPLEETFSLKTLDETNSLYREKLVEFAETALREALDKANLNPIDIDCLITTSCTGYMSPSLDAFLINRLGLKPDVQRMPVTEMGCIGGAVGLVYAENYLRAYPDRYVALISAELTTLTFQHDDFSWANIVSTAIFGDGIACAILGPSTQLRPAILGSRMLHFPETTDLLGFNLSSKGFQMVLSELLPNIIRKNFFSFLEPLLSDHGLQVQDIDHWVIHPGGKKILQSIDLILRPFGKTLDACWDVFSNKGNMSSATVLFILQQVMEKNVLLGQKGIVLGIGPGLTLSATLLEWQ